MSRLLVLGNAGLDIGLKLPRLAMAGETLVGEAGGRALGGKGANQAVVAARTGLVDVWFRAPVGDDAEGREVAHGLRAEGFATLELPILSKPTDLSVLMVLPGGENAIVSAGDCAHALSPDDAAAFAGRCTSHDWLLLQGNLRPAATAAAVAAARAAGGRVMLNTAPVTDDMVAVLARCDVVVANAGEATQLFPAAPSVAAAIRQASGGIAIVTLGGDGCVVAQEGTVRSYPAPTVRSVDTTGAGDAFCGLLAAALAAGRSLDDGIEAAQRAAALTVTRAGAFAALPSAGELRALLAA